MLKLETDAVTQELKEIGREEQQIKGKTTAGGLKEKNKIKQKTAVDCLMNSITRSPGVMHPTAVESQLNQEVS